MTELGTLATPAILILTGAMYLAGRTERNTVLREFGLSSEHFSWSLQSTVASGYLIVLISGVAGILGLAALWILIEGVSSEGHRDGSGERRPLGPARRFAAPLLWGLRLLMRINFYFLAGIVTLTGSSVVAQQFGSSRASALRHDVDSGCPHFCFAYITASRSVIGRLIDQDDRSMAVYTFDEVVLFNNADILAIRPYARSRTAPPPSRHAGP